MTIMNLSSICPVLPLTIETAANKAELPLVAWALLTAVQLSRQPGRSLTSGSKPYIEYRMLAYGWAICTWPEPSFTGMPLIVATV